jgi:asparagine synthase (glutamine-hydrolysing)
LEDHVEFLILPDSAAGARIAELLGDREQAKVISHSSGRPWIIGHWREDEVVSGGEEDRRIVLLGYTGTTAADLLSAARKGPDLRGLDHLARNLTGSCHLLASYGGRIRAQGTVSAVCRLFQATIIGTTVLADRPQALAALAGTGVDEALAGQHLLVPGRPWPLSERCVWKDVTALPADSYVVVESGGGHRITRWWTEPESQLSMRDGAERVHAALDDAVAARAQQSGRTSADLSGGMDSTSLSFLLNNHTDRLLTTRLEAADPANDDAVWATRAAADLPDAEHLVIPRSAAPLNFAGALTPVPDAEGPFSWLRTRGMLAYHAREVASRGSTRHLTGHGGDELFYVMPAHDHSMVRSKPLRYLSHMRANRSLRRWKLGQTVRFLADNTSYGDWLASAAATLTAPLPKSSDPSMAWGEPPRLPPWATPAAIEANRAALLDAAASAPEPLSTLRAQHNTLEMARACGDGLRRANWLTTRLGVSWHAPFVDDRVIEAAMSVRIEHRVDANSYKPVLAAAMRGAVPEHVLGRPTKGEFSADVYAGLQHHKREIVEQCADLEVARLGLVDADAFRTALLSPHPASRTLIPVLVTLACESWLRSVAARAPLTRLSGGTT